MSHEVGELIWKLKADVTGLERALVGAEKSLQKTSQKGGGALDLLTSKWTIAAGVATGAAYAMIRASPSLSFAMEEIGYRFEYMLAVLGEEFAPLLEEIAIPAIDAFTPKIEEMAPKIGEVVEDVVSFLTSEEMQNAFDRYETAMESIASSMMDIAKPALDTLLNVLNAVAPPVIEQFIGYLEWVSTILETRVVHWVSYLSGETTRGLIEALKNAEPYIRMVQYALEAVGDIIWREYGLLWYLQFLGDYFKEGFKDALTIAEAALGDVSTQLETTTGDARLFIKTLETIWDLLEKITRGEGEAPYTGPTIPTFPGVPGLPGIPGAGYITPGVSIAHLSVEVHTGPITSDMDIRTLTERISRELKNELERSVW